MTGSVALLTRSARRSAVPGWLKASVHMPGATNVTMLLETVQRLGVFDVIATGSPELAAAETGNGGSPMVFGGGSA